MRRFLSECARRVRTSILGRIFGNPDAALAIWEAVREGDPEVVTAEIKREWLRASTGQVLARRFLAFVVTPVWLGVHVVWAALATLHTVDADRGFLEAADVVGDVSDELNSVALVVYAFYFGGEGAAKVVAAIRGRKAP